MSCFLGSWPQLVSRNAGEGGLCCYVLSMSPAAAAASCWFDTIILRFPPLLSTFTALPSAFPRPSLHNHKNQRNSNKSMPLAIAPITLALCALLAAAAPAAGREGERQGVYTVQALVERQIVRGLGFEIQSDSIGSGNHGLPLSNSSVPADLVPAERQRFFTEMLAGFRYCRLALGLYLRGLSADRRNIVERWPGQAALLAEMARASGIEGFAAEYWSPAPAWKTTDDLIGGRLLSFNATFLAAFALSAARDVDYLEARGLRVVWWGLQNEPPVGPDGCVYSCCGYNHTQYYLAFRAVAGVLKRAFPALLIHCNSWGGQQDASMVAADPAAARLVDAWTFHRVGANSSEQILQQSYFLANTDAKPVANNEFEYLDGPTSPARCLNTAQSIMNWLAFEDSPFWYWLHALKPTTNEEASGYGLGYWRPWNDTNFNATHFPDLPPGHFQYNDNNWNAVAGFARYMPWDSVRLQVDEDAVRLDARVLAYRYSPMLARWRPGNTAASVRAAWEATAGLRSDAATRRAATHLGVVLTNAGSSNFTATVRIAASGLESLTLQGFLYGPRDNNTPLGNATAARGDGDVLTFNVTLAPLSIHFWLQAD